MDLPYEAIPRVSRTFDVCIELAKLEPLYNTANQLEYYRAFNQCSFPYLPHITRTQARSHPIYDATVVFTRHVTSEDHYRTTLSNFNNLQQREI